MTSDPSTKRPLGVIGVGLLGSAIAERLLHGGFSVVVHDLAREKSKPLLDRGAFWSDDPFADCDRIVFCLYTSRVVEEVLARFERSLRAGHVLIDASTSAPEETIRLAERLVERGIDYLEAPIFASSEETRRGEGVALVAGPPLVVDRCRDVLGAMVSRFHYVGAWGNAAKIKLVNNLILGLNRAGLAEGLCFAESIGLDPAETLAVLRQSNCRSHVMEVKGDKMVARDFSTQARLSQHAKDIRLVNRLAESVGLNLPLSELHLSLLDQAERDGLGDLDNSAIIQTIATVARRPVSPSATRRDHA